MRVLLFLGAIAQGVSQEIDSEESLSLLQLHSQRSDQGPRNLLDQICANGTLLNFNKGNLKTNNLGGMGPGAGPPVIHYTNVGAIGGRQMDMIVSVPSPNTYFSRNNNYVWRRGFWSFKGRDFIKKYNGAHSVAGAGCVGSLNTGTYQMHFKFVYADDQSPATIPYLPMTFYDIDGGKEITKTCGAQAAATYKPTAITGGCQPGGCCTHNGAPFEIPTPTNWEALTSQQKKGAVAYLFQDASEIDFQYSLSYPHRIFIFKGSYALVCDDQDKVDVEIGSTTTTTPAPTTTTTTVPATTAGPVNPCNSNAVLSLTTPSHSNLGGKGPDAGDEGVLYPAAGSINGVSVDIKMVAFGAYEPSNTALNGLAGSLGAVNLKVGTSATVDFILLKSGTSDPVSVDGMSITFLDLDEGKRGRQRSTIKACDATVSLPDVTELSRKDEGSCTSISSSKKGSGKDNPTSTSGLSDVQKKKIVTVNYGAGSKFRVSLALAPKGDAGRNFNFAFEPVVDCDKAGR